ncbi:MAG: polysaccharide deacetylase family protein, partial [Halanaerobiales bacterium]
ILFSLILSIILLNTLPAAAEQVHRVKAGEDLYSLAIEYNVTPEEIVGMNRLRNPDRIHEREVLIIPDESWPGLYRVQPGETLRKIAEETRVPVDVLVETNNIKNGDQIRVRQPLSIPYRYVNPQRYLVNQGDTVSKIADWYGISSEEIIFFNELDKEPALEPGQILEIPAQPKNNWQPDRGPNYKQLFPDTLYRQGGTGDYKIALTFDDGPDREYTPRVLDVLREYEVPATFFLLGKRVEENPELVTRIKDEGHIVANHTWSHVNLDRVSGESYYNQINKTEKAIERETGLNTSLMRTPEGIISENVLEKARDMGYRVIYWSVDSRDWLTQDVDKILINTLPAVKKDSIILLHSAGGVGHDLSSSVEVLPELIETLRMRGYTFVNLDELLNVSAYK